MEIVFHGPSYSLLLGAGFFDEVFCLNSFLADGSTEIGSIWSVEVTVQYDKKKKRFGFSVKKAEYISSGEQQTAEAE